MVGSQDLIPKLKKKKNQEVESRIHRVDILIRSWSRIQNNQLKKKSEN